MKQLALHVVLAYAVLFVFNAHAKVVIKEESGRKIYHFSVDGFSTEPTTIEGKLFYQYTMRGVEGYEGETHQVGSPEIPVIRLYVDGEGDILVKSAVAKVPADQVLPWPIVPVLAPRYKHSTAAVAAPLVLNRAAYESRTLTGDKTFEVEEMGIKAGVRRRLVTLYPLHSVPAPKFMELLEFEVSVPKPVLVNESKFRAPDGYAIVIPPRFRNSEALKRLMEHKKNLGYQVFLLEIDGNAKELPNKLRHDLMTLYANVTNRLKYVLIVGANADIPGFPSPLLKDSKGVTDHYYACLDNLDYEKDRNAPDVAVGRFSARTEEEFLVMVQKNIRYERGDFQSYDWLKRATFIATDDVNHWQYAENSNRYTIEKYMKPLGFTGSFPEAVTRGGDHLFAKAYKAVGKDVLKALKEGRGFVNYSGHGLWDEWETPNMTKKDILELNHEATPFIISNACDTAQFVKDSFGEAWQRHSSGSIVFIGSMDTSEWAEDSVFQKKMADLIFGQRMLETRKFMHEIISEVWRFYGSVEISRFYWENYAILGDSSLRLRTELPHKVDLQVGCVANEKSEAHSGEEFELHLRLKDENGNPLSGARITLLDETRKLVGVINSNQKGQAVLPVSSQWLGKKLRFFVSGDNLVVKEVDFQVPASK